MRIAPLLIAALLVACSKNEATKAGDSATSSAEHAHELKKMTPDEVEQRIAKNDGKFFVFDNNPKEMFDEGHLPGAKWVEFDKVKADVLPADKKATLVFYCANEQ
jgi:ABC-type enterochelin transport system substrate-binding protein